MNHLKALSAGLAAVLLASGCGSGSHSPHGGKSDNPTSSRKGKEEMTTPISILNDFLNQDEENKFTGPDAVGSLGGIPLRFSGYITAGFVEYEDTPTGLSPEWKTYKIPERTLQSPIRGFTLDVNLDTGKFFDARKDSLLKLSEEGGESYSPWVSAGFNAKKEPYTEKFLNKTFEDHFKGENFGLEIHPYHESTETQYDLQVYRAAGKTKANNSTATMFINRDRQGNVKSFITCSNVDVPHPPCTHLFLSPASPYILFDLSYSRYRLQDWQKAEELVHRILAEFADNAKHPERKL